MIGIVIGTFVEMCLGILLYEEIKYAYRILKDLRVKRQCNIYENLMFKNDSEHAVLNLLEEMPDNIRRQLEEQHSKDEED